MNKKTVLIAVLVVAVIGLVAGIAVYRDQVARFRIPVVVVDDTRITMRYFLKRVLMSGEEPMTVLDTLLREQIIKQTAPASPYNIEIQEKEIDQYLREIARGDGSTVDEKEFGEWYRQQLNESRLSNTEFRDMARTGLLSRQLALYLAERVPTVAEQVHLHMITVADSEAARNAKERLDGGDDFGTVAQEFSVDQASKDSGGDLGWLPRAALPPSLAKAAFDDLDISEISDPHHVDGQNAVILMISEKAAEREIDSEPLRLMAARAYSEWLTEEKRNHKTEFHGFSNGYDMETDAWVRWQLMRMAK